MAKASDARRAAGQGGRARRHSARHQGPVRHAGRPHPGLRAISSTASSRATNRPSPPILGRRRGDAGQAQHGRVRHGLVQRDLLLRPGDQSRGARDGSNAKLVPGRLVRRLGGRRGGLPLRRRDRHRHRRLDPPAGRLHRHRRHQADLWPLLALGHRRLRLLARPGRPDRARRARRGDHAAARWPASTRRTRPPSTCPVPDYEAALGKSRQGHEDRHSAGIPHRRHAGRDRGALAAGHRLAEASRRRDRRHLAAAHEIRAAGLLHRRPGRGLVQPRPL